MYDASRPTLALTVAEQILDVVTVPAFFVALGPWRGSEGRTFVVEGEFLETVCGIPGSRTEIVMLKPPGDGTRLEFSSFVRPGSVPGSPAAMANELGLRNVAFEVSDLRAAVDWAALPRGATDWSVASASNEGRLADGAYVRGPEGITSSQAGRAHRLRPSQRPHLPQVGRLQNCRDL